MQYKGGWLWMNIFPQFNIRLAHKIDNYNINKMTRSLFISTGIILRDISLQLPPIHYQLLLPLGQDHPALQILPAHVRSLILGGCGALCTSYMPGTNPTVLEPQKSNIFLLLPEWFQFAPSAIVWLARVFPITAPKCRSKKIWLKL